METKKNTPDSPRGFTIVYQILLTMLLISLIPVGGLWYISIFKAKQDWTAKIYQELAGNTQHLVEQVNSWASMNLRLLQQNSYLPALQSMDHGMQNPVLRAISDTYPWIYLAFTVSAGGENNGRSDSGTPKDYSDREYFQQVMAGKDIGQQVLMGKTSGKPAFILSRPIRASGATPVGVIAIAMTLEDLSATITKIRIGNSGFAILVDERNRLIAHGNGAIANELQDMSAHPVLAAKFQPGPENFLFREEGKEIVAYMATTNLGWRLIVQQDAAEAYRPANQAQSKALVLLGVTLAAVFVVALFLAGRLATPIRQLTVIADEISRGKLGQTIGETRRNDEIGALARAIERMGVSLQIAMDRLRKRP